MSGGFLPQSQPPMERSRAIGDGISFRTTHQHGRRRWTGVKLGGLLADYVGMGLRPIPPGGGLQDFALRTDSPVVFLGGDAESQRAPMFSLLGIERPALTSIPAVASGS